MLDGIMRLGMVLATTALAACSFDSGEELEYPEPAVRAPFRSAVEGQGCPGEDAETTGARLAIARARAMVGLPALRCDPAASAAASGHCRYLTANGELTHFQTIGRPAFTGVTFEARLARESFVDLPASEVIANFSGPAAIEGPRGFLDSVYHRAPFLRSETVSFGYGHDDRCVTIDFGKASDDARPSGRWIVWPPDGATTVPGSFHSGAEIPNPLPGTTVVGYPVSLFGDSPVTILSAEIVGAEGPVDAVLLTATTDPAHLVRAGEAHLIPKTALSPRSEYRARFSFRSDGETRDVQTSFSTGTE